MHARIPSKSEEMGIMDDSNKAILSLTDIIGGTSLLKPSWLDDKPEAHRKLK